MRELCDRFFRALTVCTGREDIKTRLVTAWLEELDAINPDDLPSLIRDDFQLLREAMYAEQPLPREHAADASVRKMALREAANCAELIAIMYRELVLLDTRAKHTVTTAAKGTETGIAFQLIDTQRLN